jgi:hypothetical protein
MLTSAEDKWVLKEPVPDQYTLTGANLSSFLWEAPGKSLELAKEWVSTQRAGNHPQGEVAIGFVWGQ